MVRSAERADRWQVRFGWRGRPAVCSGAWGQMTVEDVEICLTIMT